MIVLGIILLLIGLTALYVAAEFGAVGIRRSRLRRQRIRPGLRTRRVRPPNQAPMAAIRRMAASPD